MAELKYKHVPHEHQAFLARAGTREGFTQAYEALALEYALAGSIRKARPRPARCHLQSLTRRGPM